MKIVALASKRCEPDWLVDEMCENLSWCDEIIIYDDSKRPKEDTRWLEHERYTSLHELAGRSGADYCLTTAPDVRWSENSEYIIREHCSHKAYENKSYFGVNRAELFEKEKMRIDWGLDPDVVTAIYPHYPDAEFTNFPLHNGATPVHKMDQEILLKDVWIYNLKPIERINNATRVKSYKQSDPDNKHNWISDSYDYLDNEEGIILEDIPVPYHPVHRGGYISEY